MLQALGKRVPPTRVLRQLQPLLFSNPRTIYERNHISASLQRVLDKGLHPEENPKFNQEEIALEKDIHKFLSNQDIRGMIQKIGEKRKEGKEISNVAYPNLLLCIKQTCNFDPNAPNYLEMIVKQMSKENKPINTHILIELVRAYTSSLYLPLTIPRHKISNKPPAGKYQTSLSILEQFEENLPLTVQKSLYSHIFDETTVRAEYDTSLEIYHIMDKKKIPIGKQMLLGLLKMSHMDDLLFQSVLERLKDLDEMKDLHKLMVKSSRKKHNLSRIQDAFLSYCSKEDFTNIKPRHAIAITGMVNMLGVYSHEVAEKVFKMHPKPDLPLCTIMMKIYSQFYWFQPEAIIERLDHFKKFVVPNILLYQYPIGMLLATRRPEMAENLLVIAKTEGCMPNHWVYLSFIQYYTSKGDTQKLESKLNEMESYGMFFGVPQIRRLVRFMDAKNMLDEKFNSPKRVAHLKLQERLYSYAKKLPEKDLRDYYSTLAVVHARGHHYEDVINLLDEMSSKGLFVKPRVLFDLARHLTYLQANPDHQDLLKRILKRSIIHCVSFTCKQWRILLNINATPEAFAIFAQFWYENRIKVTPRTLNRLLMRSISFGKRRATLQFYSMYCDIHYPTDPGNPIIDLPTEEPETSPLPNKKRRIKYNQNDEEDGSSEAESGQEEIKEEEEEEKNSDEEYDEDMDDDDDEEIEEKTVETIKRKREVVREAALVDPFFREALQKKYLIHRIVPYIKSSLSSITLEILARDFYYIGAYRSFNVVLESALGNPDAILSNHILTKMLYVLPFEYEHYDRDMDIINELKERYKDVAGHVKKTRQTYCSDPFVRFQQKVIHNFQLTEKEVIGDTSHDSMEKEAFPMGADSDFEDSDSSGHPSSLSDLEDNDEYVNPFQSKLNKE